MSRPLLFLSFAATAVAQSNPCGLRTDDVPCLYVENCANAEKLATFGDFQVSNDQGNVPAQQQTSGSICYDATGIHIKERANETHIFTPYAHCDDNVWVHSDVLEVFVAPVLSVYDNPQWYFELDTAPSGAMWGGLINNTKGNVTTCVSGDGCDVAGPLPCSGLADFDNGLTVTETNSTNAWSTSLFVPWELFASEFRPSSSSAGTTKPWSYWRANFYRYDYPNGPNANYNNYELTAWSPTHSPSFHEPSMFGVLVLV
jgi:hypothetical protein